MEPSSKYNNTGSTDLGHPIVTTEASQISSVKDDVNTKLAQLAITLSRELTDLRQEIANIRLSSHQSRSRLSSSSRSRNGSSLRSRSRSRRPHNICWYHWRFAAKAVKCEQPCSYQKNEMGDH